MIETSRADEGIQLTVRHPRPALQPFVRALWVSDQSGQAVVPGAREHAIPTGEMHLVIRLTEEPVRIVASHDAASAEEVGRSIVAGLRSAYHIKDVSAPAYAVGAQLHPAACMALFEVPADTLAHRHVALEDLWSRAIASEVRERLAAASTAEAQLDLFEQVIAARLPRVQGLHPAVAFALQRLHSTSAIETVVRESGYSHRTLAAHFRRTIGLTPKRYLRVRRMRKVLRGIGTRSWTDLALEAGFSDQAHFVREFREFTGVTPTYYLRSRPERPHHVRILQDAHGGRR